MDTSVCNQIGGGNGCCYRKGNFYGSFLNDESGDCDEGRFGEFEGVFVGRSGEDDEGARPGAAVAEGL